MKYRYVGSKYMYFMTANNGHRGYVGGWLRFDPLGKILYCYDGEGVVSLCYREFANDIDAPPL
jgi:hypothetical protein